MSKTNLHETDYLKLVFQNINISNIGDATGLRGSTTAGSFYVALFTADPTETGATANEATYTSYARVAVARSASGWTVSGNQVTNAGLISFPTSGGTNNTITHFAIMTASSGGDMIGSGSITSSLLITSGDTPKFEIGDLTITED